MRVLNQQWDDALRNSIYPFQGLEDLVTQDGLEIPRDAFLDMSLLVPLETTDVRLLALVVPGNGGAVECQFGAGDTVVGTALMNDQEVILEDRNGMNVGFLRLDIQAAQIMRGWPAGTHVVDRPVLPHLLVATPNRARKALRLPDGTLLTGTVDLVGGEGVWLDIVAGTMQVSVVGNPYAGRTGPARSLRTINGKQVENFQIGAMAAAADQVSHRVKVEPTSSGIQISLVGTKLS